MFCQMKFKTKALLHFIKSDVNSAMAPVLLEVNTLTWFVSYPCADADADSGHSPQESQPFPLNGQNESRDSLIHSVIIFCFFCIIGGAEEV